MQSSACFVLLLTSLVCAASAQNAPQPSTSTSTDNTQYYDQYQGVNLQDSIISKPASQLNFTLSGGNPFFNPYATDRLGTTGPLLLQGVNMLEQLAHFVRERVPERIVHAKGAGAHGYFEVTTKTAAKLSRAKIFSEVGKKTSLTARFSTIAGSLGAADSTRDLRGLAFKMRTEEGILDWVFLNHPVFWLRDPIKFIHLTHSQKPNPTTHVQNFNDYWDYQSANNESIFQVLRSFSDLGTPYGFRYLDGFSGHTFRAIAADGTWNYIKITAKTNQGIKNQTQSEAVVQAGESPDFGITDLFGAIEAKQYPSWTVSFQVMTPQQAEKFKYNIFDLTKEWLPADVPLQEIGRIVLNQNPVNYFSEVEQVAFNPSQMPPGLEPTEDPLLQARLFVYADAHRYRVGLNNIQLPVNAPTNPVANFLRDGHMNFNNQGNRPNFHSTQDPIQLTPRAYNDDNHTIWVGGAVKYASVPSEIDFDGPRIFWSSLSPTDQEHLISNVIGHLGQATDVRIKTEMCKIFAHVNTTLGESIAKGVNITL